MLNDLNIHWYLLPLVLAISLVYGGTRHEDWRAILNESLRAGLKLLFALGIAYALIFLVASDLNPWWYLPIGLGTVALSLLGSRQRGVSRDHPVVEEASSVRASTVSSVRASTGSVEPARDEHRSPTIREAPRTDAPGVQRGE